MGLYFSVLLLWFIEFVKKIDIHKMAWIVPKWPTIPINMSKFYIIKCCQAFLAVTSSFKSHCLYAYTYFCGLKYSKLHCFFMPINQDQFWGPNAKYVSLILYMPMLLPASNHYEFSSLSVLAHVKRKTDSSGNKKT